MDKSTVKSEVIGRVNFDSEFCGSIPLNFINLIQPHGVLMTLEKESYKIVQVSDNCNEILNIPIQEILNTHLNKYINAVELKEIEGIIKSISLQDQVPRSVNVIINEVGNTFTVTIHNKEKYLLLEFEKEEAKKENTFTSIHQTIKFIVAKLKEAKSIEELSRISAQEIKTLSKFDRVMIYKFDEEWNGSVVAEAKEEDMEPYLNLRFPASDIPKQARELYLKNPFRLIPDISAKAARLFPVVNPITHSFTDLSDCNLRSAPAVHLEYLKNMNISTSMSTPIIKENKLWGLISCHHKTPKFPGYEMISAFELLAGIISTKIISKETEHTVEFKSKLINTNTKIIERLYKEDSIEKSLLQGNDNILQLLNLTGVAIIKENGIHSAGKTPDNNTLIKIVKWAERRALDRIYSTDCLSKIYPEAEPISDYASGLIAIPLDIIKGYYILGFRPEVKYSIEWGGNPYNAINLEGDGKTYHPRNSFSLWKEIVKKTSLPWAPEILEAAEFLRTNVLQKIVQNIPAK